MKSLFFIFCSCAGFLRFAVAQTDSLNSDVQRVLDASNKSLHDFALITVTTALPALPAPGADGSNQRMAQVRDLLWKQISAPRWRIDILRKNEDLDTLYRLCDIRAWLLRETGYTNTVLASYIEENVSMAVLGALTLGSISVAEAQKISTELTPETSTKLILQAVQSYVAESEVVNKFKHGIAKNEAGSLLDLADQLSKERNELLDLRLSSLLSSVHPASLVLYAAQTAGTSFMASGLVEYVSKGGSLNLDDNAFRSDVVQRTPGIVGVIEPVSRTKVQVGMLAAVLENVREWNSKH